MSTPGAYQPERYTRRQYLILRAMARGYTWAQAIAAANRTAERCWPDWDCDETRTFAEWEEARAWTEGLDVSAPARPV